jgi:asparagine synthase (glutamine-hydrolysing)
MELYTEEWLGRLAEAGRARPDAADPTSVLTRAFRVASRRDLVTQTSVADMLTYLPCDLLVKVDMASMAHSLECRGPFLDHRVAEFALGVPINRKLRIAGQQTKKILKDAFAEFLPAPIKNRPKMGFGVPIDAWLRDELRDELRSVLLDPTAQNRGLFRPEAVASLIDDHLEARRDQTVRLWSLLMLELWFKNHIDQRASPVAVAGGV